MTPCLPALRSVRSLLLLLGLAFLTGCGSNLVDLDLPPSVEPGGEVEAEVVHEYDVEDGGFIGSFAGAEESSYIFSAIIPDDWTPLGGGIYRGFLGEEPFSRDVAIIPEPPETNLFEVLTMDDIDGLPEIPPEAEPLLEQAFCDLTPPEVPPGSQLVWYQTEGTLPDELINPLTDGGVLTVEYRAGNQSGSAELTYQHGVYLAGETLVGEGDGQELVDISFCLWFISEELSNPDDGLVPDMISGRVQVIGLDIQDIPALGAFGLILLSLIMAFTGAYVGRRRHDKR